MVDVMTDADAWVKAERTAMLMAWAGRAFRRELARERHEQFEREFRRWLWKAGLVTAAVLLSWAFLLVRLKIGC